VIEYVVQVAGDRNAHAGIMTFVCPVGRLA
jgi:hypothetical protein